METEKYTVWVIDDDKIARRYLKESIQRFRRNISTEAYENAFFAVKQIEKGVVPDLIILDYDMPFMNGMQFCNFLNAQNSFKIPPVIIRSCRLDDDLHREFNQYAFVSDIVDKGSINDSPRIYEEIIERLFHFS